MIKNLPSSNPNPNFPSSMVFPRQNDDISHPHSSDLADISHSGVPHSDYQSISSEFENCSPNSDHPAVETVYHVGFNQDYSCFVMGTNQGFRIYNCDPLSEYCRRDLVAGGGIGIFEMLFRSNIMALVGGGAESEYPKNKLMIWNDHHNNYIGELSFRSDIKAVRLRRDKIVVVLLHKIMVYNFADLKVSHQIETFTNPKGLCQVSQVSGNMVLVCPGLQKGQVRVEHYALRKTKFIVAHDSSIACLALNSDGRLLATASSKGTLIRVFNTLDGSLLQELRRGADRADIYSLAFSSTSQWLAVSSDKGTIHVFSLKVDSGSPGIERSNSSKANSIASAVTNLSFIKGVLPRYFSSEWSVAQFRLPEGGTQYIVAFGHKKHTIVIVGMDGSFYRCEFDPESGGEMKQLEFHNVLKEQESV